MFGRGKSHTTVLKASQKDLPKSYENHERPSFEALKSYKNDLSRIQEAPLVIHERLWSVSEAPLVIRE
ncbi:MAG TPA: hypothetical protein DCE42_26930 [Myxococcales bacterium]|nr:hypothetical protein [Deltaproteobacteria bacterium]MBU50386.1 hypothetical protein [Deltaproteobacteria bacterium]HAA58427.1 hypothetical protein [Myxococcales bacterium]